MILEERISKLEKNSNEELKSNVQSMKGEIIESIRNDIDKFVDNRNRELEDRWRRDHNIVCFNSHNSPIGTENKEKDESGVSAIASQLGLQNLSITSAFRLGKKLETKIRPLNVVLENKSHRKFLIDNAKLIPEKVPLFRNVFIVKDMTFSTAKGSKFTYQNIRKSEGNTTYHQLEENRGQGLAEQIDVELRQSPEAMTTEQRVPSPVFRAPSNVLSQENVLNDTTLDCLQFSQPYHNETLINDDTIVGGMPMGEDNVVGILPPTSED